MPRKQAPPKRKAKEVEEENQQIEKILEVRPIKRKREFRVKLKDQSEEVWLPENKVGASLIKAYEAQIEKEQEEARQRFEESIKGYLAKHEEKEKTRQFTCEEPIEHHNCCLRCVERCLLSSLEVRDAKRAQEALETAIKMSKVDGTEKNVTRKKSKHSSKKTKMNTNETMNDAIQIAAENDNIDIAESILSNFEGIQVMNCFQYDLSPRMFELLTKDQHFVWTTAIQTATRYGATQTIKLILTKCLQTDSDQKTKFGVTPLHLAALTAAEPDSLPKPLNDETINAGAFVSSERFNLYITPLHLSAMNPNPRIFKTLIENGGDITVLDDNGWGPVHYSIMGPEGIHLDALAITPEKVSVKKEEKAKAESEEDEEDEEEEEEEERPKKRGKKTTAKKPTRRSTRNKASDDDDEEYKSNVKVTSKRGKQEEAETDVKETGIKGVSPTLKYILRSFSTSKAREEFEKMAFQGHRYRNVEEYMSSVTVDAARKDGYFRTAIEYGITPVVVRMIMDNTIDVSEDHLELALINKRDLIFDLLATALGESKIDPLYMHLAAKEACVKMAMLLVTKYNAEVNTLDEEENTPLHIAVSQGLRDLAAFLLSKGAKYDGVNIHGATVLLTGTRNGHRSCVQLLVEKGVDVNTIITVKEEEKPAEAAPVPAPKSEESEEETSDVVMSEAPPPEKKESTTVFHDLMRECNSEAGRLETAQYLINVGANIFARDSEERTPLDMLVRYVPDSKISADVLALLIKTAGNKAVELVNNVWEGYTPLLFAASTRKQHFCEKLVEVPGINLNATVQTDEDVEPVDQFNGKSVLHLLVQLGSAPLIKRALELGADPNKYSENSYPPILDTTTNDCLLAFLEHKSTNPTLPNKDGSTIVHKILQTTGSVYNYTTYTYEQIQSIDKLLLLLEKCPNINLTMQDSFGKSPLHYAAINGQLMCVKTLLKKGVPIDTEDQDGNTPLCCALLNSRAEVAIYLIDAGANFNRDVTTNPKQQNQGKPHKKHKKAKHSLKRKEEAPIKHSIFQYTVQNNSLISVMYCILESGKIDYTTALSDVIAIGNVKIAEELISRASAKMSKEVLASSQLLHSLFSKPPVATTSRESLNNLISSLLAHKVPLNNQDKEGMTSLMHAIANHHDVEVVDHLIELGAKESLKVSNSKGLTALHLAVLRNQFDIVELLLQYVNTPEYVNAQENNGNSSLHYSILPYSFGTFANYPLISKLISCKASPVIKNKSGYTPAYLAGTLPAKTSDKIQKILRKTTVLSQEETEFMEKEFLAGASSREKREKENHEKRNTRMNSLTKSLEDLKKQREIIKKKREEEAKHEQENRKKNASKYFVPIDECFWGDRNKHRVYVEGEDIYDVMLNQTDISHGTLGHNKYYVLQLIQVVQSEEKRTTLRRSKKAKVVPYKIINRWGRVGTSGKSQIEDYYSLDAAKASFTKKFQDKTKNKWENRENFEKFNGKYDIVERYYELKREKKETTGKEIESKLAPAVQDLMSVITDLSGIKHYMTDQSLDIRRMPLGRLSHQQITEGYKILVKIEKNVKEIDEIHKLRGQKKAKRQPEVSKLNKKIEEYSSEFYTLIPHNFGFSLPPPIDSVEAIQTKTAMLDSMQDIEAASNLLSIDTSTQNALDVHYSNLGCDINELPPTSEQFEVIKKYIENTKDHYNPKILNIYKVRRWEEVTRFDKHRHDNSVLLWHGSPTSNFCGILSQGLRIAPPEAPSTGYMFGKGIYFADAFTKSAGYCRTAYGAPACLLLCEVALGECYERKYAEFVEKLPPGKGSTHGCGRKVPQEEGNYVTVKDTTIPLGVLKDVEDDSRGLQYNEFIVYDVSRVKIKYIVMAYLN